MSMRVGVLKGREVVSKKRTITITIKSWQTVSWTGTSSDVYEGISGKCYHANKHHMEFLRNIALLSGQLPDQFDICMRTFPISVHSICSSISRPYCQMVRDSQWWCRLLVIAEDFRDPMVHVHIAMIRLNYVRKFHLYKTWKDLDIY